MKEKNTNSNQALYTKYRPQKFSDVIGQEYITNLLDESIKSEKLGHAYLFIGSRGTGKTSVARIFANNIGTTKNDLYEIDAASNNSVEDIRSLNEAIYLSPLDSKYKVYILDEVHMLSKSAFNALLKTLEEPPKHAIFILATTEPHKIPDTIISRCETYNFKTPNQEVLKKMIRKTAKAEGMVISNQALDLISILGDGSFRDTHTILQKLLKIDSISHDHEITLKEVEDVTGAPTSKLINNLILAIIDENIAEALKIVYEIEQNNFDPKTFYNLLMQKYRAILLMKVAKNEKNIYEDLISEDELKMFSEKIEQNSKNINSKVLLALINVFNDSLKSIIPFLPLELFLVEILAEKS